MMRGRREEELASHSAAENGLGITVRAWRRSLGLSVTDLALLAGFGKNGRGYISRVEHGQIRHLGEERLKRIAEALQVQSTDLLLHRMPEAGREVAIHDLDEAIIGGKALLKACGERSVDWARMQLLLAKLYHERATTSPMAGVKHTALIEAQRCIESSLLVFTSAITPQSFREATQLGRDIGEILDTLIVAGSMALLKRCSPQSLDWARVHVLLAKLYGERAAMVQGVAARTLLTKAQHCLEIAIPIFTQRQVQRSLKDARQLYREITDTIKEMDGG